MMRNRIVIVTGKGRVRSYSRRVVQASVRLRLWLLEHQAQWHALCILLIIAAACVLFYKNFTHPGMMMATDMTWPSSIARMQFKVTNMWSPYGSGPSFATPLWFYWIYPSSMAARTLGLSVANYMLIMFIGTFSFAGISMYALAYSTIRKTGFAESARYAPFLAGILSALVYMYNPWSLHYFRPYFAYPTYAFLPLMFLMMAKTFDNPRPRNVILFALLVTVVNTSYALFWFWGMLGSYLVFYLLINRARRESLKRALQAVLGFVGLYMILNAHWLLPYLSARAAGQSVNPFYSPDLNATMLQGLSSNSTMLNNFRLVSIWSWSLEQLRGGMLLELLAFSIPIFTIIGLILVRKDMVRNRTASYWAALATVALLLATGTRFVLTDIYDYFVFHAPGSGSYGWMFRSPERWLFFVPVFFSLILAMLLCKLLLRRPSLPEGGDRLARLEFRLADNMWLRSTALAVIVAGLVLVSMYPKALEFGDKVFAPTKVPSGYGIVQKKIGSEDKGTREAWVPFLTPALFEYEWAPSKRLTNYGVNNSNPSLSSGYEVMNNSSYFNWIQNLYRLGSIPTVLFRDRARMLDKDVLSDLFVPFAARFIVHDRSVKGFDFGDTFSADASLKQVLKTRWLDLYETDYHPGYFGAATRTIKANSFYDNLAFIQKLPQGELQNVAFTDGESYFGGVPKVPRKYGALDLRLYERILGGNPEFEERTDDGRFTYWSELGHNSQGVGAADGKVKRSGHWSLRVTNGATGKFQVTWVVGDEVSAPEGSICSFESKVRYRNSNWTLAGVDAYDNSTGAWVRLIDCPSIRSGDSGWKEYRCSFLLPPGMTRIRPILGAGWTKDPDKGKAISWFEDVRLSIVEDSMYADIAARPPAPSIKFTKISAEKYRVKVSGARAPFVLVQSEAYDSHWTATTSAGKRIEPIPMYATINGFPINQTGDFELSVEYRPQHWFSIGLILSLLVFGLCLIFLLYDWKLKARVPPEHILPALGAVAARAFYLLEPTSSRNHREARREIREAAPPDFGGVAHKETLRRAFARARAVLEEPPGRTRKKGPHG